MDDIPLSVLLSILVVLLAMSGFFSMSETAMMASNRFRLRHLAQSGHRGAQKAIDLLDRTDKMLGVILLGNNLVNSAAATLVSIITIELFGEDKWALGAGTLAFNDFSGLGRPGTGTLKVDGKVVDQKTMPKTLPMILQWDESFDIGSDTLTGVNDADYTPPFALTAKLDKLTIRIDRPQLSPADIARLKAAMQAKAKSE